MACTEDREFTDVARVPCGPEYCKERLQDLFRASMIDESLFPPRCCRPMACGALRLFLTSDLIKEYQQKIEFDTPNRTYCSSPQCSTFLRGEDIIEDRGTCPHCSTSTCTICKLPRRDGDCPAGIDLQLVLVTARGSAWQRCYFYRQLVELNYGCNHMAHVPL